MTGEVSQTFIGRGDKTCNTMSRHLELIGCVAVWAYGNYVCPFGS